MKAYTRFLNECRTAIMELNMTFEEVGKYIGVSRPRVSKLLTSAQDERGMSLRIAMKLADLLGVSIDECMESEEDNGTDQKE